MISIILTSMALGVVAEVGAVTFGLWRYRHPVLPALNVMFAFGLVQGLCVAWALGRSGDPLALAPVLFMTGAVLGIFYEGLNSFVLLAWSWPDRPLLGMARALDKAAVVGVSWGLVPVVSNILVRAAKPLLGAHP